IFSVYILQNSLKDAKVDYIVSRLSSIAGVSKDRILDMLEKGKLHPSEPILVKDNLSLPTVSILEEEKGNLPGVAVTYRPVRTYPYGRLAAHLLGYVGETTKDELGKLEGYKFGDFIGKEGVEKTYDRYLRGIDGGQQIEVDVYGQPTRIAGSSDPVQGKDIILTVDLELQKVVENSLEGKEGAVVVLDPRNGEVLALSSQPNFDPSIFAEPMASYEWERMDSAGHPFMNRALSVYPPGSTFKVVTLSSILQENKFSLSELINCTGEFVLGNRVAKCWRVGGHGKLNILEGLVWSCDVVYYTLGLAAGPALMSKYSEEYGLGSKTGIDLPGEMDGFIPTEAWKQKTFKIPWFRGDSINMAIGQGSIQVTPIQMAELYATIATGERYRPYVVKVCLDRDGKSVFSSKPEKIGASPLSKENQEILKSTLREVVRRGTGVAARIAGFPAAGKTGTAENPDVAHAWFMCYAPYTTPEVVSVSFVAHGEHGDRVTAYIARDVLAWYKENKFKGEIVEEDEFPEQYIVHGAYKEKYVPR
ncbi:MAG: penicillin-binding protein 2, partial [Candidatus Saganbacteria bacterium]|nr:penicillin-binding protein 2 [Candidatus Saganbacteria bacterium]